MEAKTDGLIAAIAGESSARENARAHKPAQISSVPSASGSAAAPLARDWIRATMASEYAPPAACRSSVLFHGQRIRFFPRVELSRDRATTLRRCVEVPIARRHTRYQ